MPQGQQRITHPEWIQQTRTSNSFLLFFGILQGNLRDLSGSFYAIFKFEMLCNSQGFTEQEKKPNLIQFQSDHIFEEDNKDTVKIILSSPCSPTTSHIKVISSTSFEPESQEESCAIGSPIIIQSYLRCLICNHELPSEYEEAGTKDFARGRRSRADQKDAATKKKLTKFFSAILGIEAELRAFDEDHAFETNEKKEFQFCSTCQNEISILHQLHTDFLDVQKKFEEKRDKLSAQIVETFLANERPHLSAQFLSQEPNLFLFSNWKKMYSKNELIPEVEHKENEPPGETRNRNTKLEKKLKIRKLIDLQNMNSHFNISKLSVVRKEKKILFQLGTPREKLKLTCLKCSISFDKLDSFNVHLRRHKMKSKTKLLNCFNCNKKFESRKILYQHKLTHMSENDQKMHCVKCNMKFAKRALYNSHMKIHNGKTYVCEICNSVLENQSQLKKHMAFHSNVDISEPDLFSCKTCSKTYLRAEELSKHLRIHEDEDVIGCEFCGMAFKSDPILKEHIRSFHSGGNPYLCEVSGCNQRFSSESLMVSHLKIHRPKEFICSDCGKACRSRDGLRKHLLTHKGQKPFQCHECNLGFIEKKSYDSHMTKHTGKLPFICNICPQSTGFKDSKHLRQHKFETHPETIKSDKKFTCEYCWNGFSSSENLATHVQKSHERYKCNSCDRVFKLGDHLRRHMYIHTGEKPYKCNLCEKAFNQESNLKEHLYRHSGIRPHQCSICSGVGFLRKVHLKDHMMKEHGISEVPSLPMGRAATNARKIGKHPLQIAIAKSAAAQGKVTQNPAKKKRNEPDEILPTLEITSVDSNSYFQVDDPSQDRQIVYIVK